MAVVKSPGRRQFKQNTIHGVGNNTMNNTRRTVKKLQQVVNSIEINNDLLSNISSNKGDTATLSAFSASIVNNVITSADLNRKAVEIYNNSSTNILYVSKNNISSLTLFSYKVLPGGYLNIDNYTGVLSGIWDGTSGEAMVTITL